jgi:hypothetical protein
LQHQPARMLKIFGFDPLAHRDAYQSQGWVHVRNGITADFFAILRKFAEDSVREHRIEGRAIGGEKEQSLYEFPQNVDFPGELFDMVAAVCGLNRSTMTLSERHIKAYDAYADPEPPAHKDRFASQVSMGLSIDIPDDSRLILYPFEYREVNPFNVSATFRDSLDPDRRPEVVLKNAKEVEIDDSGGDVVIFPGSSMWHLRRNAARAVTLYLKFNDFNSDPLGEDPTTAALRARTLHALSKDDRRLTAVVPILARRMDTVARLYTRSGWEQLLLADVWGESPIRLTEVQFEILRGVDGTRDLGRLSDDLANSGASAEAVRAEIIHLAERGILDLIE